MKAEPDKIIRSGTTTGDLVIAKKKLEESREWLRAVFDASRDGIMVEDAGVIVYVNKSHAEMFGYANQHELIGKNASEVLPADQAERMAEYGRARLRNEAAPSLYEFTLPRGNSVEALNLCRQKDCKFDLLMTDVVMPQMGGRELVEILTGEMPSLRVLFTSGYTDAAVMRHGIVGEKTNFIQKPFNTKTLARKVREILDAETIEPGLSQI